MVVSGFTLPGIIPHGNLDVNNTRYHKPAHLLPEFSFVCKLFLLSLLIFD